MLTILLPDLSSGVQFTLLAHPIFPPPHLNGVQLLVRCVDAQLHRAMGAPPKVFDQQELVDEHHALLLVVRAHDMTGGESWG